MVEMILILVSLVVKNVTGERDERDVLNVLDVRGGWGVTCVWGTTDPTPRTLSPVPSSVLY